jgi:membrane associated rhomboid family serine protease
VVEVRLVSPSFEYNLITEWLPRFFTAIFLHAGLVHLALNMLGQWVLCGQVEQEMGSPSFLLLYFAAGIFGNILGGNFALVGVPSVSTLVFN